MSSYLESLNLVLYFPSQILSSYCEVGKWFVLCHPGKPGELVLVAEKGALSGKSIMPSALSEGHAFSCDYQEPWMQW